jgi:hypothetical protein
VVQSDPTFGDINKVELIVINLATGLFALYLAFVAFDIFPFRLLEPLWMITFATALCDSSSIPLAGLALVHLAVGLNPDSQSIRSRRDICARLAAWAALGFLMLLPLIGYANWKGIRNIEITNKINISSINKKANELSTQIIQASSQKDLQERMAKFQGPALPNESLALPLDELKKQTLAFVQSSAKAFVVKTAGPFSEQYIPIYKQSLRAAAISFVAALSFAAGAWNPRTNTTVLNSIASLFSASPLRSGSIYNVLADKLRAIGKDFQNKKNQANLLDGLRANSRNEQKIRRRQEHLQKQSLEKQRKAVAARDKKRLLEERKAQKRRGQ